MWEKMLTCVFHSSKFYSQSGDLLRGLGPDMHISGRLEAGGHRVEPCPQDSLLNSITQVLCFLAVILLFSYY